MSENKRWSAQTIVGLWGVTAILLIFALLTMIRGNSFAYDNSFQAQVGLLQLISVPPKPESSAMVTTDPAISYNGRYVVFGMSETFEQPGIGVGSIVVRDIFSETSEVIPMPWEGEVIDPADMPQGDHPSISSDGRFVAFTAQTYVPSQGDIDGWLDVYLYDRVARTPAVLISKPNPPIASESHYDFPQISADGNYVLFQSLVNIANSECSNYFIYSRLTDQVTCLGIPTSGEKFTLVKLYKDILLLLTIKPNGVGQTYLYHLDSHELTLLTFPTGEKIQATEATISADGRYFLFMHLPGYAGCSMFVEDLQEYSFTCLDNGEIPYVHWLSISPDGRWIAFNANTPLVQSDTNSYIDVYLYDRATGAIRLISQSLTGQSGNDWSDYPQFSADGRFIVFISAASDLVENDLDHSDFSQDVDLFLYDLGVPVPTPTPLPTATTMADVRQNGEIRIAGNLSEGEVISLTVPLINVGNNASFALHPYIEGTTANGDLWRADGAQPHSVVVQPGELISFTVTHPLWSGHAGTWQTNGVFLWNDSTNMYDKPLPANGYSQQISFLVATLVPTSTPIFTPISTAVPTNTPMPTLTPTRTPLPTFTAMPTNKATPTFTSTDTPTSTFAPTNTSTPPLTSTVAATLPHTPIPTQTITPPLTPTPTFVRTTLPTSTPPFLGQPLRNVAKVENGFSHTCVLTLANGVKCWGSNAQGQLGDGTTTTRLSPVAPVGLSHDVTFLDVGYHHNCVLDSDGDVKCWGANEHYQLGDGTNQTHLTPVKVVGLATGVTAIAAGGHHTCVLTASGGVKCWGLNDKGQLGDGTQTERSTPVDVVGLESGVMAIAATGHSTCAITNNDGIKCWGDNQWVQLGDGTSTNRSTPVDVIGLTNGVEMVSPAGHHTCALLTIGGVKCWGFDYGGEVGDGPIGGYRPIAVDVVGLNSGVQSMVTGGAHSCALLENGSVKCWGWNNYGQLGNNVTANADVPVEVVGLNSHVSNMGGNAGDNHTCVVTTNGGVKCWGSNNIGQLGDGTMIDRMLPVDVIDESSILMPTVTPLPTATAIITATNTPPMTEAATIVATGTVLLPATATPQPTVTVTLSHTPTVTAPPDDQAPLITRIMPSQGYNDIPNEIMIYGSNFQDGLTLRIGSQKLVDIVWRNNHQVQGVVPAGLTVGTYDIIVDNPNSTTSAILSHGYSVLDPAGDDFSINDEDLWTTPPTIHHGDIVLLGVNVHRKGGKTPKEIIVAFYQLEIGNTRQLLGSKRSVPILPGPEVVEPIFIEWDTRDLPAAVDIIAVIDPYNTELETTKGNNEAHATFSLLPLTDDLEPPTITHLQVNRGVTETTNASISVTIEANDMGASGIAAMYLIEREFNASARQWVAIQNTGWITFQNTYQLTLAQHGGIRYIQALVRDRAGNISETMVKTQINHNPPSDRILAGQVRLYRYKLMVGQRLRVHLDTLKGDADLYVWQPDGARSWVSNAEGTTTDGVNFVASESGNYQIEIFGYQASNYQLSVSIDDVKLNDLDNMIGSAAVVKLQRLQPIVPPGDEPDGGELEAFYQYLPTIQR